jgi:hypothetical protein
MLFRVFSTRTHSLAPLWLWLVLIGVMTSLGACTHWRDSYLKGAVEEATQEDVMTKLGEPWRKKDSLLNGESTWIYRYTLTKSELDPMGVNTLGKGVTQAANTAASLIGQGDANLKVDKPRCFHYLLTFDSSKILKHWVRESCADTSL